MAIDLNPLDLQARNMVSTSRSVTARGLLVSVDRHMPTSCGENLWCSMASIPIGRCIPGVEDTLQAGKSAAPSSGFTLRQDPEFDYRTTRHLL